MEKLYIEPGVGIGPVKLGMSKKEVEECIRDCSEKFLKQYNNSLYIERLFKLEYDSEDNVNFIEIDAIGSSDFDCLFNEINVFKTQAEELVEEIDKISKYDREQWDLGFTYHFPELGLTLWRPVMRKADDLKEAWFKELEPDIQEDEMRNLYFRAVSLKSK
ncbi:hypothetical protein [Brevibacillus centrosporus]|uniref:Uncharacterized protein n=1 Tax=Brevibacillus centrosporus TaxID=54910 RepID=A0A1I3ZK98_9BACL|nr:hypothetical protein [Brevibacillus centrosporus]SFK44508.1 hypothetical protein SAMN05518846_113133 [Brevibacillus centrosporus]